MQQNKLTRQNGFTLIEILVSVTIFSIIAVTFLNAYTTNITTARYSRWKTLAAAIASEKMESLKNLPYDQLSTVNGAILPQGSIPDEENILRNKTTFVAKTIIAYFDDPYDGCAIYIDSSNSRCADGTIVNKPQDYYPYDYKKITLKIFNADKSKLFSEASTNIASHAAETATNTGIIAINVVDATGTNIADAEITITNTALVPAINITTVSSGDGATLIPLLPPSALSYHVSVTKGLYSTDSTYPITAQNPTPVLPDATIIAQKVTNLTLAIDLLSYLDIYTKDSADVNLGNQILNIKSKKSIDLAGLVPKYTTTVTTDANGYFKLSNIEWGSYQIESQGSYILTANPYSPILINPDELKIITLNITSDANLMRIYSLSPNATAPGSIISFVLTGENLTGITAISLKKDPETPLQASNIVIGSDGKSGIFDIDLTTINAGLWNLEVTKGTEILTQKDALQIN